jgi:hypothetical protein
MKSCILNKKTRRCRKIMNGNKNSFECRLRNKTKRCYNVFYTLVHKHIIEFLDKNIFRIKLSIHKNAIKHLYNLLMKTDVKEMRLIAKNEGLHIKLPKQTNKVKLYLLDEILTLCVSYAKENDEKTITIKTINEVIYYDYELRKLLETPMQIS